MSLNAYLAGVRWRLWASTLEVYFAAQHEEIPIAVSSKGKIVFWMGKPKHVVKLQDQHFTLHTLRRRVDCMHKSDIHQGRGGMRQGLWTWEEETTPVSITYRPTPPTPPPEEIPAWAIENTPLQTVVSPEEVLIAFIDSEERSLPMPYVTRVHVSPSVRTGCVKCGPHCEAWDRHVTCESEDC